MSDVQAPEAQAQDTQAPQQEGSQRSGIQGSADQRHFQAPQVTGAVLTPVRAFPPNYAEIIDAFPHVAKAKGPIFCYGTTVYYTGPEKPDHALMRHEAVHSNRQGADPKGWWDRYLRDTQFRFIEELLAHRVEWQAYEGCGRSERRFMKRQIAERLSGPLYGRMVRYNVASMLLTASPAELDDVIFDVMKKGRIKCAKSD